MLNKSQASDGSVIYTANTLNDLAVYFESKRVVCQQEASHAATKRAALTYGAQAQAYADAASVLRKTIFDK